MPMLLILLEFGEPQMDLCQKQGNAKKVEHYAKKYLFENDQIMMHYHQEAATAQHELLAEILGTFKKKEKKINL